MSDEPSDLSDDIVPDQPKHSKYDRKFAPWHKVRKEYVRKEQWNKFINRFIDRYWKEVLKVQPLQCLVIPGDDLLDIRSLHRDTESNQCSIRYLGFNSGQGSDEQGTRVYISHNDVTSLERVSNDSYVVHGPFQSVGNRNSMAFHHVKQLGPFHVANLDLCDSLFPNKDGDIEAYFKGLHGLAAYQMKEMTKPWLLFITTEVAPNEVDVSQFDKLCEPTKKNVETHPQFKNAIEEIIPVGVVDNEMRQIDCSLLNEKQLVDLFGIAIGKALLGFCSSAGETWKVGMLGSHEYTINEDKKVSMLSLAFQFAPMSIPPEDPTGLSSLQLDHPKPFDELELANKIVASVKRISNIDEILASDPGLQGELLNSSADLLAAAGYDRDDYVQWVREGEKTG